MNSNELREGIFALNTRRFGSVLEIVMQNILKCTGGLCINHDLYDEINKEKIEVKCSRVQRVVDTKITNETILKCINEATSEQRSVSFDCWNKYNFDCNIQQIKKDEFDVLYYGLFFSDYIKIFKILSEEILENKNGGKIDYSNKQHKGNEGEGQFHITEKNINHHVQNYLYKSLTYEELYNLLKISCQETKPDLILNQ